MRNGLSADGTLYAVPFYAESSFTFYREDLFEEAGLTMPEQPTYDDFRRFAEALHDPENQVYGVCLRGKPGWGENMAYVSTLVNTFGGRWFDMDWQPQLDTEEWNTAIDYYVDMLNNYGPPGASSNGHNENRALFASGNCGMWVDATSAAGYIYNPSESKVADTTAFAPAPIAVTPKGANWFWAWALAIPSSSTKVDAAKSFLEWATSKEYVELVGETEGWVSAPPGTRQSTYERKEYLEAAPFADFVKASILSADPSDPTMEPVPYTGVQFVAIPEFQGIGTQVGQSVAALVVEFGLALAFLPQALDLVVEIRASRIRRRGVLPVVDAARVLALDARYLASSNTFDRLRHVAEAVPAMAPTLMEAREAYQYLLDFRLERQLRDVELGEAPSSYLDPSQLTKLQQNVLRNAFTAVNALQRALIERYDLKQGLRESIRELRR